jgi:hypothetical protein
MPDADAGMVRRVHYVREHTLTAASLRNAIFCFFTVPCTEVGLFLAIPLTGYIEETKVEKIP